MKNTFLSVFVIYSQMAAIISAPLLEIASPLQLKDRLFSELMAKSEDDCKEDEGDGLIFSCDSRNDPVVVVEPGQSLQLNCTVSGSRNMAMRWTRDRKTVFEGPAASRQKNSPFMRTEVLQYRIGCVTPQDAGVYECVAHADGITIRRETTVFVLTDGNNDAAANSRCTTPPVKQAPKIYAFTDTVFDKPGADVRLACRASGKPAPSITWFKRQGDMNFAKIENQVSGYTINANGDLVLPPLSVEPIHFSEYKCEAKNDVGRDTTFSYVQVTPADMREAIDELADEALSL